MFAFSAFIWGHTQNIISYFKGIGWEAVLEAFTVPAVIIFDYNKTLFKIDQAV